ncbi:SPAC6G9.01c [Scenedesmus sp. PABB004]|nr:SPAC6G9.01c [Scenedesmus sp. PABB004]
MGKKEAAAVAAAPQPAAEQPGRARQKPAKQPRQASDPAPAAAAAAPARGAQAGSSGAAGAKRGAKEEIDAIFGGAKKQRAEPEKAPELDPELRGVAAEVAEARQKAAGKRPKVVGSKDDIFGEGGGAARKRTEEGYAIYREDELGLAKHGGDTALCPFDCDCCF